MPKNTNNPANMTKNKLKSDLYDPYSVIEDFFLAAPLAHYRKYISSMVKAAYSEGYWKKSDPASLLYFQEQMIKLIIGTHVFTKNRNGKKAVKKLAVLKKGTCENEIDPSSYIGLYKNNAIWESFPRSLSKKEFADPYLVFKKFFEYKNLEDWLSEFKEIISFALSPFGTETAVDYNYLAIKEHLQKLVEAAHLIEVRVNRKKHLNETRKD